MVKFLLCSKAKLHSDIVARAGAKGKQLFFCYLQLKIAKFKIFLLQIFCGAVRLESVI